MYPRLEGLYHYMLARGAELDGCLVVELEGHRAPDVDFDADEGAVLMIPAAIRNCIQPDRGLIRYIQQRAREMEERV